jgi:hypothetical protein
MTLPPLSASRLRVLTPALALNFGEAAVLGASRHELSRTNLNHQS